MSRRWLFLAAILFVAYAWFYQAGGWNQNSRFALVRAIVERGTLRIDDTVRWNGKMVTGDYAKRGAHVYSDKAPGLALAAVPIVLAAHPFVSSAGSRNGIATLSYIATLATAAAPTVVAALLVAWLALALGASAAGALVAALVFGLGTPAWAYATLLFGHALATACVVGAFAAAVALREARSARRDVALAASAGLAAGWGTITEYPTAVPAVIVAAMALATAWPGGWPRRLRVGAGIAGGAVVAIVTLMAYDQAAFGAPLNVGYAHLEGFGGMKEGFLGVTYPKAHVLGELTFGRFRGLFVLAPVLLLGPVGLILAANDRSRRLAALSALGIAVYYVLFNASYHYWNGGWSYGPRHLAPALPFLALGLAPLWTRAKPALRVPIAALGAYGAALALVAVSVTAQPPDTVKRPIGQLLWPAFRRGDLAVNHQAYVESAPQPTRDPRAHAWNLGQRLGFSGKASLAPLLGIEALLVAGWVMALRRASSTARPYRSPSSG